ncbi:hypothetical protein BN7_4299 [Wickerhamomyces ciferrii]|uniref:Uncharacterized protein n=1 Tax=Wickerhamomyces ciferrii (strain ATCC 14091 / BCRC 22168 / CBS 111 / JCM 3599 / NBRC 0793 / NRRL Y-1031 F-60-10) TaxID=1206466 RepID=K0KP57_WICCF|nr:uncharacterized protein BN7_4299 [Wickerhamomyces ciferrii]CCH44731.1 hypothetical protein BN7_4299 [Wickerhamomyces ciferrii]
MSFKEYSVQQLRSIVIYGLDNDLLSSAEFAAERLVAETTNSDMDSLHLYGLVLLKLKRYKAAYNLTANESHAGCTYVFAKAALALGKPFEGISTLFKNQNLWENIPCSLSSYYESNRSSSLIPDTAVFYNLLAKLFTLVDDYKESAVYHSKALKENPFLWESIEELNKMGANYRVKSIYKIASGAKFSLGSTNDTLNNFSHSNNDQYNRDPFGDSSNLNPPPRTTLKAEGFDFGKAIREESPEFQTPRVKQSILPNAPTRKTRSSITRSDAFKQPPSVSVGSESIKRSSRLAASKVSSRLTAHPLSSATKNSTNMPPSITRKNSGSEHTLRKNKIFSLSSNSSTSDSSKKSLYLSNEEYGEQYVIGLYSSYAKGFKAMSRYDSFKAIRLLSSLPENHKNTPWTLSKLGRLHFDIVNYEEALVYFKKLRELDPTRIEDMEYYSTLLWHLQDSVALCNLAHELQSIHKNTPEAWVAIGNLFSLNKDPDEAIKCFQRATQIDSKFVYAYTLQGHEYVSNDAYDNALECFRTSLVLDPRHFNALYGIGMVNLKLGNFHIAEFHFRKASQLNPVNPILMCCLGMMLEKLGKRDQALEQYELAAKLQPLSALPLFKKAQLLYSENRFGEALVDLQRLEEIAPDEASVHYLLGQLYKYGGRKLDAIVQYTAALNLDPKGAPIVKMALESLQDTNQE